LPAKHAKHAKTALNWSLHPKRTFSIARCQPKLNEKGVGMDFRRGRCDVRLVTIRKSDAHESAFARMKMCKKLCGSAHRDCVKAFADVIDLDEKQI
jgi:hypothetical protein